VTLSLALAGYTLLAAIPAARRLAAAGWPQRVPRLGVAAWLVLVATTVSAALLAFLTLALPPAAAGHELAHLFSNCLHDVTAGHTSAGTVAVAVAAGTIGAAAVLVPLITAGVRHHQKVALVRHRQHAALALMALAGQQVVVLPDARPAAYCVPGRTPRVVLTQATVTALQPDQLAGVIAHERAHLRGRHAVLLALAAIPARAFRWATVFDLAHREVAQLLEMMADDAATQACRGPRLAAALLTLAEGHTPSATFGAGGASTVRRARRLLEPLTPLSTAARFAAGAAMMLVAVAPVAITFVATVLALRCHDVPGVAAALGHLVV
jgi:Zn-dependent protease with chaperone function